MQRFYHFILFNNNIDNKTKQESFDPVNGSSHSLNLTESSVVPKYWKKNETIYFLNHKTDEKTGFPCMTNSQDVFDPGKPCIFPFDLPNWNFSRLI